MADKNKKDPKNYWEPYEKKCKCGKKCYPGCKCSDCQCNCNNPKLFDFDKPPTEVPAVTVEVAIEMYRKAKMDALTAQNELRRAKEVLAVLEERTIITTREEQRVKTVLERAFAEEAKKKNG